ncbi:hypothetical protein EB837_24860 [Kluyvera ascorbata]|uniref:Uncharacterized protein n=1 Tax=Kluyvera ascorbata TaxID=51288 RepID=A0A3N2RQ31_9ENTR|nr:hypothetical protein EB837_24860 [Kluyvera ascorbata]
MDSVHHIWCPLSSQEFQDLPDGAETTLTIKKWWGLIFDALDVENKTKIIHAFQQGGLSSVFHPSLATSKAVKIKG